MTEQKATSIAARCRQMAEQAIDQEMRDHWLRMENFWLAQCHHDGLGAAATPRAAPSQ